MGIFTNPRNGTVWGGLELGGDKFWGNLHVWNPSPFFLRFPLFVLFKKVLFYYVLF